VPDTLEPFDLTGALPFDRDANDNAPAVLGVAPEQFLYLGQGLTAAQFAAYVASYSFGRIPPDQIVLHHTAIPSTLAARYPTGAVWDANEAGLSREQIKAKRLRQLGKLRDYYRDTLGWDRGPHIWIDDLFIYLFTPMSAVGIHAKEGNSFIDASGKLHYSLGIEVLGYYEHVIWPGAVAANVAAACQTLSARLGIELTYRSGPLHTPSAHALSLASHRDYNKPQCPGAAITEAYYTSAVRATPSPLVRTVKAGPRGAIAQQDRKPSAPTAGLWYPPGSWIQVDDLTADYWHAQDGTGFIPRGQVEE
jgi:N-acetylmuramoyl-L-alanine amidase-like protein